MAEPFEQLRGCLRAQPHPAAALTKALPAPGSCSGSPLVWGVPKNRAPSPPVQEAERTQGNGDERLLRGHSSKPPSKGSESSEPRVVTQPRQRPGSIRAPRPRSSSGAADPGARRESLTNTFVWMWEPTLKSHPSHPAARNHPSLTRCRKSPEPPGPRVLTHWNTAEQPKPPAPNRRLFSPFLLPKGPKSSQGWGKSGGKWQLIHNTQGGDAPSSGRGSATAKPNSLE